MAKILLGKLPTGIRYLLNIAVQGFGLLCNTICTLVVVRHFGSEAYGFLVLVQATAAWVAPLLFIGMPSAFAVLVARKRNRRPMLVFGAVAHAVILLLLVSVLVFPLGSISTKTASGALVVIAHGLFFSLNSVQLGAGENLRYSLLQSGRSLVWLGCIGVLIALNIEVDGTLLALFLAASFLLASFPISIAKLPAFRLKHLEALVQAISRIGTRGIAASTLGHLLLRADTYLVGFLIGTSAAGAYGVVQACGVILIHTSSAVGQFFFASAALPLTADHRKQIVTTALKLFLVNLLQALLIYLVAVYFVFDYVRISEPHQETTLAVYLMGMTVIGSVSPIASYLAGRGYESDYLSSHFRALVAAVFFSLLLIPLIGALGAATASSIAQLCLAYYLYKTLKRL